MTFVLSGRLSVRAFTQLFDEDRNDDMDGSPLFTDTFLSLPVVTEAGELKRTHTFLIQKRPVYLL